MGMCKCVRRRWNYTLRLRRRLISDVVVDCATVWATIWYDLYRASFIDWKLRINIRGVFYLLPKWLDSTANKLMLFNWIRALCGLWSGNAFRAVVVGKLNVLGVVLPEALNWQEHDGKNWFRAFATLWRCYENKTVIVIDRHHSARGQKYIFSWEIRRCSWFILQMNLNRDLEEHFYSHLFAGPFQDRFTFLANRTTGNKKSHQDVCVCVCVGHNCLGGKFIVWLSSDSFLMLVRMKKVSLLLSIL